MAMFMLPVTALDVAGIEKKLLQTIEMITAKKRKVSRMVMMVLVKTTERRGREQNGSGGGYKGSRFWLN